VESVIMLAMTARDDDAIGSTVGLDMVAPFETSGTNQLVLRDRILFGQGDAAHSVYRILSGVLRIYKLMPDGRRHVTDFLIAGDVLGFEVGDRHRVAAEAVVDCVVRRYPRTQVDIAAHHRPDFARRLLDLAWNRLAAAQAQLVSLGRKTAEERLASFLLALSVRAGRVDRAIALPMSRADIADHLGLTIETVSRLFTRLRKEGVIDLPDAHSFRVLAQAALEAKGGIDDAA
jgi:CRP/FNR family transcriptional regulator